MNYKRAEIKKIARQIAIHGIKDSYPVPPFSSLRGEDKFKDYPGDTRVEVLEQKRNEKNDLVVEWDRGNAIFGKDSGSFYDRVRVYYKKVLVFDPSTYTAGTWEDKLYEWYELIKSDRDKR